MHLVAVAGVGPDAERPAEVVEDDRGLAARRGPAATSSGICGWYSHASKLRPIAGRAWPTPSRNSGVPIRPGGGLMWLPRIYGSGSQRRGVADAAEQPAAGVDVGVEHRLRALAEAQVGVAHDGADRGAAVGRRCPGLAGRDARSPRPAHASRAVGAVARHAVDEDGGDDVVAGARVGAAAPRRGSAPSGGPTGGGADRRSADPAAGPLRGRGRARRPRSGVMGLLLSVRAEPGRALPA